MLPTKYVYLVEKVEELVSKYHSFLAKYVNDSLFLSYIFLITNNLGCLVTTVDSSDICVQIKPLIA